MPLRNCPPPPPIPIAVPLKYPVAASARLACVSFFSFFSSPDNPSTLITLSTCFYSCLQSHLSSCLPVRFLSLGKLPHLDRDSIPHHRLNVLTAQSYSGTGYIGSFTALALLEAGYKVVVADNLYNSSAEALRRIELISGKKAEFAKVDVTDEGAFDKVFEAHPDIDSVIHFAALKVCLSNATYLPRLLTPAFWNVGRRRVW